MLTRFGLVLLCALCTCSLGQRAHHDGWMDQAGLSDGLCRYGNSVECCWGWRWTEQSRCQPHCQQGCKHGECVGPDRCKCHSGYTGKTCNQDLNECGMKPRPCKHRCMNTIGSYKCYCLDGFTAHPDGSCRNARTCYHANCQYGCEVIKGAVRCTCPSPGLRLGPDRRTCIDIDECVSGGGVCPRRRKCVNTFGSFMCKCHLGLKLTYINGRYTCIDKDVRPFCSLNPSSPKCRCDAGSCSAIVTVDLEPQRPRSTRPPPATTATTIAATSAATATTSAPTTATTSAPIAATSAPTAATATTSAPTTATTSAPTAATATTTSAPATATATTSAPTTPAPTTARAATPPPTFIATTTSQVTTTTTATSTTPAVTPPAVTPPAVTPPAVTPPAVTPPAVTPPAVTPPAVTPPAVTPPAVTPPAVTEATAAAPHTAVSSTTAATARTSTTPPEPDTSAATSPTTSAATTTSPTTTETTTTTTTTTTAAATTPAASAPEQETTASSAPLQTTTVNNRINKEVTHRQRGDVHIPRHPGLNQVWEFDIELGNTAEDVADDPDVGVLRCGFDGGVCDWMSDGDGDLQWETAVGPAGGRYLSVPELKAGQRSVRGARLAVQIFPPWSHGDLCFSFSHWLTGHHVGVMQLFVRKTGRDQKYSPALWSRTGGHGWRNTQVTLTARSVDKVLLKAERRKGRRGLMAVDDVTLRQGACR